MTGQEAVRGRHAGTGKRFLQVGVAFAVQAGILLSASGRPDWAWAWVYLALYVAGIVINGALLLRRSPETIARRASAEGVEDWDKAVGNVWSLLNLVVIPLVAGLDTRFAWSLRLPLAAHLVGAVAFVLGFALFSWAMVSNAYFSTLVRVHADGSHRVCTTGPYRFVRHPGYTGAILQGLALPLMLGSLWTLIPGALAGVTLMIRTALEDRTLQQKLTGYAEYARKVRYRLAPGIW